MSILSWLSNALLLPIETKSASGVSVVDIPQHSASDIRAQLAAGTAGISAIQLSAVFACARVIAEGLAQVPCLLQRTATSGGHELATDHPLFDLLNRAPNEFQTSFEFREWLGFQLAAIGNAFVYVARDTQGRAIELIPLAQGTVSVTQPNFGEVFYRLNVTGQPYYTQANIWHIKGPSWNGIEGMSFQAVAARALGLASDLEDFGAQLFKNGARPSGVLETDQTLTAEQHKQLSEAWHAQQAGIANAHKTALLSSGLKFQQTQANANDAQFIEARRYQTEEICRIMRVDPVMIMQATGGASYASIEQRFLAHLTHTIAPWHQRFEQSAEKALLSKAEQRSGYRVHLDSSKLMRASAVDSANFYGLMSQNGFMSRNEVREALGLDRVNDPEADKLIPAANLYGPANGLPAPQPK